MSEPDFTMSSIIGYVLTGISLLAGYFYYRRSRQYKELSWEPSTSPLLSVGEDLRTKVQIIYKEDGSEVQDIDSVTIKIVSSGTLGVEVPASSVTESPVTIDFGEGAKIVGAPTVRKLARVDDDDPEEADLNEVATIVDSRKIVLKPILLNPGALLSIGTPVTNLQPKRPKVTATIRDVRIQRRDAPGEVVANPPTGPQAAIGRLIRGPVVIIFPVAYVIAVSISQVLGSAPWTRWISALFVSLLIYFAGWFTVSSAWKHPEDYIGRLIYVVLNTSIIVLLWGEQ